MPIKFGTVDLKALPGYAKVMLGTSPVWTAFTPPAGEFAWGPNAIFPEPRDIVTLTATSTGTWDLVVDGVYVNGSTPTPLTAIKHYRGTTMIYESEFYPMSYTPFAISRPCQAGDTIQIFGLTMSGSAYYYGTFQKAPLPPKVVSFTTPGSHSYAKAADVTAGYTNYEVVCVGASGGSGAHIDPWGATNYLTGGGGGGGGGVHRVTGLLSSLATSVAIVVGQSGAKKTAGNENSGGDGGATTFGSTLCRASGGKAGGDSVNNKNTNYLGGVGGLGGVGNSTTAGGGPAGAGTWNGTIGSGGRGGAGGVLNWATKTRTVTPASGSAGAVGTTPPVVTSNGGPPANIYDVASDEYKILGGFGGGVNLQAITGVNAIYGSHAGPNPNGAVFLRLT